MLGLAAGAVLWLASAGLLLATSNLDRRDPASWSLYAAMLIVALWPPGWLLYTSVAWGWFGATAGMRMAGIRLTTRGGVLPGTWHSAGRAVLLAAISAPLLLCPLLIGLTVSLGTPGPVIVAAPVVGLVLISAAGCLSPLYSPIGEAWHDRLSGTRVVLAAIRGVSA
jgi:hypothetical protein